MYGANNLVWTGVQNATAGTVYTTMYGFSTAGVAAAYFGGVVGVCIGYVFNSTARQVFPKGPTTNRDAEDTTLARSAVC